MWQQRSSCRRFKGPEAQLVDTAADMDLLGCSRSQVWESKKRDDCYVCQVKLSEKRQDLDYQVVESFNLPSVNHNLCKVGDFRGQPGCYPRETWALP